MSNTLKSISYLYGPKELLTILIILLVLSVFISSFIFFGAGAFIATALYITCKVAGASTHDSRSFAKYEMENYKKVVADLDKTIALDPKNAVAYHNRGSAKRIMEDCKGAIADHDKAIKLKPNHADGYWFRGMAKDGIGDYK